MQTARELEAGRFDADLGQSLFKLRIARPGEGKRSGYRTIIGYRRGRGERMVFLFAYAKNVQATATDAELTDLAQLARLVIEASDPVIDYLLGSGDFLELEMEG